MKKEQIIRYISLILLFELIQAFLLFYYSFFAVGWEDALARKIIFSLLISVPLLLFFTFKAKNEIVVRILIIFNWAVFVSALFFVLYKPIVISSIAYELFLTQPAEVLNPAISLCYILFISTLTLLIPLAKNINLKRFFLFFAPIILWVVLRVNIVNI